MSEKNYDVTIIGGGPVGMYASFYAAMQGLDVKLVDTLEHLGGQLTALYPEKFIYDLPGHPKIRASEMVERLRDQMRQYEGKIDISTGVTVTDVVKKENNDFSVTTTVDSFSSKSVLITAGNGAFDPRKLEIDSGGITNLHYFVNDMNYFENKNVVIFGGGDSAVDWALMLEPVAKNVSLVHRRNDFRAHAASIEKLKKSAVGIYTPFKITEYSGGEVAESVTIQNTENDEIFTLEVDEIIVLFGFVSALGPIKDWGLELRKTSLEADSFNATSIPGIFTAGDAATFDGKIKMITTGFGEAVVAINAAKAYAYPGKMHRHQHSSTLK